METKSNRFIRVGIWIVGITCFIGLSYWSYVSNAEKKRIQKAEIEAHLLKWDAEVAANVEHIPNLIIVGPDVSQKQIPKMTIFGLASTQLDHTFLYKTKNSTPFSNEMKKYVKLDNHQSSLTGYMLSSEINTEFGWYKKIEDQSNDVAIFFDNATNDEYVLSIDNKDFPTIPSLSFVKIRLEWGKHEIVMHAKGKTNESVRDTVFLTSTIAKRHGRVSYYLYNIGQRNSYKILSSTYRK